MDAESSVNIGELIMALTDEEIDKLFEDLLVSAVMNL